MSKEPASGASRRRWVGAAWRMVGVPAGHAGPEGDRQNVSNSPAQNPPATGAGAEPGNGAPTARPQASDAGSAGERTRAALASPLRLMAVHAHPDDESSKGAASLAKYSAEGAGVVVVSCTGGERGDILNPKLDIEGVDVPALRISEMARAAEILGVAHVWLGFHDSGYHEGPPESWELPPGSFGALDADEEIAALVRVVRQFRPHVMTTYDENGGYPHPDHIRCHVVSVGAVAVASKQ